MLLPLFLTACADSFTCVKISINSLSFLPSLLAFSAEIKDSTFAISASNSEAFCVISFVFTTTGFSVPSATVPVSLNPLSPFPGIALPFLGSWFLFSFSSFLSAVAFGILSTTNALPFTSDVAFATSSFVAASFAATAFAFANSTFADSIAEAVFSVDAAFSKAASKRAIASDNFEVLTFSATSILIFSPASGAFVSVACVFTSSAACTFAPPSTANPEAIATLATPTVNLRMLYLKNLCT